MLDCDRISAEETYVLESRTYQDCDDDALRTTGQQWSTAVLR